MLYIPGGATGEGVDGGEGHVRAHRHVPGAHAPRGLRRLPGTPCSYCITSLKHTPIIMVSSL